MDDTHGTFVWYELATKDVAGAKKFYGKVIGWGTDEFEGSDPPYAIWTMGGKGLGGLTGYFNPATAIAGRPTWMAYVAVTDVDALTKKAAGLGAKVLVPPSDIPHVGRFSVIADPQGAVLAPFKPNPPSEGSGPVQPKEPTPGYVLWHELLTNDAEAAFGFYAELFGWQKGQAIEMGDAGTYQIYGKGGRDLGGMMKRPADYPLPPHWLYYVRVDDLDAAMQRVRDNGGRIWNGPMPIPGGERIAQCEDPAGAVFALQGK
jgi:uncharacterized protein